MKAIYLIGGPMGVGKTTAGQVLKKKLPRSVFLDGDWCWDMEPFQVTEETKSMVMDNICHLLNNFLHCSAYEHVIFCWVMHQQEILDDILSRLELKACRVICVSLICSGEELRNRLQRDIDLGKREPSVLERSRSRLPMYEMLRTEKVDVTRCTPEDTAELLAQIEKGFGVYEL